MGDPMNDEFRAIFEQFEYAGMVKKITQIAKTTLDVPTLKSLNSEDEFHNLSIWQIKNALEEAYYAGAANSKKNET